VLAAVTALVASLLVGLGAAGTAQAATVDTDAWYVLVNRGSGKVLDVSGVSTADGARIHQWTRYAGASQRFQFVDSGNGYYRVKAQHSGKVLDVHNYATTDHAEIVQWADHNGTNQQFRLADSPDGYVRLINRHSGKALEVQGAATADGGAVVQYSDWGGANQQWRLVRVDSSRALPSTYRWSSSGVLAGPKPDAQHPDIVAIKDFSIVRHNNQWLTFATTAGPDFGWGLAQFAFDDWSGAADAPHHYLDTVSAIGPGYRAAPQVFYFAPQDLWYMVYQTGPPTYSTSTDPADPTSWSAPRRFMDQEPDIVRENKGRGGWLDFWVICDATTCYLFFSDGNGNVYRAETSLANYPNGFGNTQIALSDTRENLFEALNVYSVDGQNQYLLIHESIGSNGKRYFRSYTADSLRGAWSPQAATENEPFAGTSNVTFPGGAWTEDISHGELIRSGNDQTLPIDPCHLQYVYQGLPPDWGGDSYLALPWRMGLLTQTNPTS
jgi:hypothetical protein